MDSGEAFGPMGLMFGITDLMIEHYSAFIICLLIGGFVEFAGSLEEVIYISSSLVIFSWNYF